MPPISSFLWQPACTESILPFLFDEKIRQSGALFWLELREVRILQIFYSPVIQSTIVVSPAFLKTGSAEKIAVVIFFVPIQSVRRRSLED
jgi:hypothetical protein